MIGLFRNKILASQEQNRVTSVSAAATSLRVEPPRIRINFHTKARDVSLLQSTYSASDASHTRDVGGKAEKACSSSLLNSIYC
jgi:hypothetical protein